MAERPVALITGASMGIGEAFADALAARGYDIVLVARSGAALEVIAARNRERGIRAETIVADLGDGAAVERVIGETRARLGEVDLLVNNAGFGCHGSFVTMEAANLAGLLRLNVEALVALTHAFAPGMFARGGGGIINVASTAAFQPVPYMAVYGASKAFVLSFSEALAAEFRDRGVRVLALCPGATSTNFFERAGPGGQVGRFRTAEQAVRTALRAYDRGASYVIDGPLNRLLAFSPRLLPRPLIARVGARLMQPK